MREAELLLFSLLMAAASASPIPAGLIDPVKLGDVNLGVGLSSLASVDQEGEIVERQLEIWWYDIESQIGDTVAIYRQQESLPECAWTEADPVEEIVIDDPDQTWARANTSLPYFTDQELNGADGCLLYWVVYLRRDEMMACNCLRTQSEWMWQMRDTIGTFKLRQLFLAGTHDAASYSQYHGIISDNPATKYVIAQGEDLYSQLQFGVRYLDMRILFRPSTEERFWTCHSNFFLRPLVNDTALIKQFMADSRDVVIFDIHATDNMDAETGSHRELQILLFQELSQWMAPAYLGWDATLDDFWSIDKRLIVTYDDDSGNGVPFLWTAVRHQWGNVQSLSDLEAYLQSVMYSPSVTEGPDPWSSMAELTPTATDVLVDRFGGLRGAADIVNRDVSVWFRDRWASQATIVASDFFLGANLVDTSIRENQRRASRLQ